MTNSGKLVPMAIIVAPITTLGTPILVARIGAVSTIKYELATTPTAPKTAINFAQAALGAEIEVPTLSRKTLVQVPPGTQSGTTLRLRGEGIKSNFSRGDQLVNVTVQIPTQLTPK